jgi:hypothetical protein
MTPEIEALYERIGDKLLEVAGDRFKRGYIRVEMADDVGSVGIFVDRGDGQWHYLVDESGTLFDDFAELRERCVAAGMGAWSQATFRLDADQRLSVDFGYDDITDLGASNERRAAWIERELGPNARVNWES